MAEKKEAVPVESTTSESAPPDAAPDAAPDAISVPKKVNTIEQKRKMRNLRKKRMRKNGTRQQLKQKVSSLKGELKAVKQNLKEGEHKITVLRSMSRTYWERWRWELEKRKEAILMKSRVSSRVHSLHPVVHEIDPSLLTDPVVNEKQQEHYIGRGSFAVVRLQLYRGIYVAVKELLPKSVKEDVQNEAEILATLCHPFLPQFYGVCTRTEPLRIIMQFHGFFDDSLPYTMTLHHELEKKSLIGKDSSGWLMVCAQILEAVDYLHEKVKVLHNDIKENNVLIVPTQSESEASVFQIVLVDFGKATSASQGKKYNLSVLEKTQYRQKYPHIAPEVVEGESTQSTYSDMFSVGGIFDKIVDSGCLSHHVESEKKLIFLAKHCRLVHFHRRFSAHKALSFVQEIL